MHPYLWAEPYIGSYRAMLLLGFIGGFLLARWRAKKSGLSPRHIDNLVLLLMVIGPAGARLCSRMFYSPKPLGFWETLKLWEGGGLVFYGGAIAGFLTVIIYAKVRKISTPRLLDIMAPSLALGLAFGRVGCFMSGCCWGDVCATPQTLSALSPVKQLQVQTVPSVSSANMPFAVQFPAESAAFEQHHKLGLLSHGETKSLPVHPTQIYEVILALGLCLWLNSRFKAKQRDGDIVWFCGIGYAIVRFPVEFIRADSPQTYFAGLTFSQVVSVWILIACIAGFFVTRVLSRGAVAELPKTV